MNSPGNLVAPCLLLDVPGSTSIEPCHLEKEDWEGLTGNSSNRQFFTDLGGDFHRDYTGLSLEAAEFLIKQGVKLVGIDYLSIEDTSQTQTLQSTKPSWGQGLSSSRV